MATEENSNEFHSAQLFDSVPELILVIGPDYEVLQANQAARVHFGEDIKGRSYYDFYAGRFPDDRDTVRDTFATAEPQSMELHSGTPMSGDCLALDTTPLFDAKGTVFAVIESVKMVSGSRHVYTACPKRCSRMQVHRERLASLGQLAAGVAHEIGNPLASMSSIVQELLAEAEAESESQHWLEQLWQQIQRMHLRLDRIRQLSRQPREQPDICDLGRVIERSLELVQFDPRWHNITLINEITFDLSPVTVVEDAVYQVVHNLVFNALDAVAETDNARIRLVVAAHDDKTLVLEVEDNGVGIPPQSQPEIFQPFFTTKPHGTGLGLAISRELMQTIGGDLTFESDEGEDTSFRAYFPTINHPSDRHPTTNSSAGHDSSNNGESD